MTTVNEVTVMWHVGVTVSLNEENHISIVRRVRDPITGEPCLSCLLYTYICWAVSGVSY